MCKSSRLPSVQHKVTNAINVKVKCKNPVFITENKLVAVIGSICTYLQKL